MTQVNGDGLDFGADLWLVETQPSVNSIGRTIKVELDLDEDVKDYN